MEKAETRDFMNVDSFSQLPFIRPAPAKDKAPVRLFGIEVQNPTAPEGAAESNTSEDDVIHIKDVTSTTTVTTTTTSDTQSNNNNNNSGSSRKFECHYCCRNFPTSQALGGHQNAHKRERQHAKRAYLQSAAMLHPSATTDPHHLYGGLLDYHHHHPRLGPTHLPYYPPSSSSSSSWMSNSFTTTTSSNHNTLNRYYPSSTTSSYHSYPSHHHHHHPPPPPITGNPLAMWRIPASGSSNRDRSLLQQQYPPPPPPPHPHPHHHPPLAPLLGSSGSALISDDRSKTSHQYLLDHAKKGLQDHVSLDLHL